MRQSPVVRLHNRLLVPQLEMPVHPSVHPRSADVIVVVLEMSVGPENDVVGLAEFRVMGLQLWKSLRRHLDRPVIRGSQAQRLRSEQRGELHIPCVNAQQGGILTGAASLHRR